MLLVYTLPIAYRVCYHIVQYTAGFRKREIQAMVEAHLKHLITQHFDPKKADLIFTEEGSVNSPLHRSETFCQKT